jgi:hypothetical protein
MKMATANTANIQNSQERGVIFSLEKKILVMILNEVKPVIKHIDYEVSVEEEYQHLLPLACLASESWKRKFWKRRGVVLIERIGRKPSCNFGTKGEYEGHYLVLDRTGTLYSFEVRGSWNWYYSPPYNGWSAEPVQLPVPEAIEIYGFTSIVQGLVSALQKKLKETERRSRKTQKYKSLSNLLEKIEPFA